MAALPLSWSFTTTTFAPFVTRPSHILIDSKRSDRFQVLFEQNQTGSTRSDEISHGKFDRRNVLLGMRGLYSAANLVSASSTFATPLAAPDFTKCSRGTNLNTGQPLDVDCCPPVETKIIDYKPPPVTKIRFRPAAHLATKEYVAKYEKAVELMKALPADDPRNFMQQANVHRAYCNLTYDQVGALDLKIQIHNCWHFYPWHRCSSLFDARRNQNHLPPAVSDLPYFGTQSVYTTQIISNNLTVMYSEMVPNVQTLEDFYGAKYNTGTQPDQGPGTVERGSHTALHVSVGVVTSTGEDMGNFYSAGREPLFFSHHTNIDRLWTIWRDLRGSKAKDFVDSNWLNATYLFYDENAQLIRVDTPWLKSRPVARAKKSKIASTTAAPSVDSIFPVKLDKVVKVLVPRPQKSRSRKDKENEEELLVIEGIEVDTAIFVKFDVFVNDEDDDPNILDKAEYGMLLTGALIRIRSWQRLRLDWD
ncbi:polyphenol oxidase I, chloroplastic-like [Olea europaea subsp. europaea]|uniref:Polyphenol oxidase I, chloroplastic-like n=1 Tax=Olea europaea subsp. europaea TaxID=158383 RepID=A0A8S0S5P5_OLEEU|nr:polyphenol oxidase I, chloroplastic-like [Olea europaea subsp. europaea]